MQIIEEEYDIPGEAEKEFVFAPDNSKRNQQVRERIEYWHELRRLRRLLDDPDFTDL